MASIKSQEGRGVLNKKTMTVHKHEMGAADLQTECGRTHHVQHDRLRIIAIQQATEELDADKCGQCFEDGRGY